MQRLQRPLDRASNDRPAAAPESYGHRRGNPLLANLTIPPLASSRPQITVADGESSRSAVRRKPLPTNASPLTPSYTSFGRPGPQLVPEIPPKSPNRSFSLGSPILLADEPPNSHPAPVPAPFGFAPRDLDRYVLLSRPSNTALTMIQIRWWNVATVPKRNTWQIRLSSPQILSPERIPQDLCLPGQNSSKSLG
jgi:hypothetical protein